MLDSAEMTLRRMQFAVRDSLRWWGGELDAMLPQRLRHMFWLGRSNLVLDIDGDTLTAHRVTPRFVEFIGSRSLNDNNGSAADGMDLVTEAARARHVLVRLPPSAGLRRRITLPLAAEENLREVLGFEMDRYTPFLTEQVYYEYEVLSRSSASRKVDVELTVVPRERLQSVLERMQALGIEPDTITLRRSDSAAGDSAEGINLLPVELRAPRKPLARRVNLALALVLSVLLATAFVQPVLRDRALIRDLEGQVASAQAQAVAARRVEEQIEALTAESDRLDEQKRSALRMLDLLRAVTRLLPDSTWVTQFEVQDNELQLRGISDEAAALVPLLESSPLLRGTRFRSPIIQDRRESGESFHLSSEIERGSR